MIAYLDIETSFEADVTVVGVLGPRGVVQLVGPDVSTSAVEEALHGCDTICTYNGDRFDLPVLGRAVGVELLEQYRSLDLYDRCRRRNVRGGLKAVEARYGIDRLVRGVNGYDAMLLWERWCNGDREALETLLAYNRDDVVNLATLERALRGDLGATTEAGSPNGTGPNAAANPRRGRAIP
jgi:uncharacterized protein YprB with RNaseH-like and TPR domain